MQRHHRSTAAATARRALRWLGVAGVLVLVGTVSLLAPTSGRAAAATTSSAASTAWIRFAHFASGQVPVEVLVNGKVVSASAKFETVTPYQSVPSGRVTVTVVTLGKPRVRRSEHVTVPAGGAATVAAVLRGKNLTLTAFADNLSAAPAGDAKVRVIDADASVRSLSARFAAVTDKDQTKVFTRVPYASASPYVAVAAGHYNVTVDNHAGKTVLVGRDWPVSTGTVASLVVVQTSAGATLEVLDDAAGATAAPSGGMQTGFGGMARRPLGHLDLELAGTLGLAAMLVLVLTVSRRRDNARGRSQPGTAGPLLGHPKIVASTVGLALVAVVATVTAVHLDPSRSATPTPAAPHVVAEGAPQTSPVVAVPSLPAKDRHPAASRVADVNLAAYGTGPTTTDAPTAIAIPALGVRTSLVKLGRNADGTAEVPATTTVAGWYDQGPAPGQRGPAVILGHVDSYQGPGVFFDLKDLQPGAIIEVREAGATLDFAVQRVATYPKATFPTQAVFGPTPERALRLVTCGGPFDHTTGHYDDNVVAYATEVTP